MTLTKLLVHAIIATMWGNLLFIWQEGRGPSILNDIALILGVFVAVLHFITILSYFKVSKD